MQKIIFGISLDASTFHEKEGVYFFGQKDFLRWLEKQLGLTWPAKNFQWLRTAYFRKILTAFLEQNPTVFFAESFAVDSYGTTNSILTLRDELRLSLWNFEAKEGMPQRLLDLSKLEAFANEYLIQKDNSQYNRVLQNGFADRFIEVENDIDGEAQIDIEITLVEPLELLPTWWRRLFEKLKSINITIHDKSLTNSELASNTSPDSDLNRIAKIIQAQSFKGEKITLKGDGSLVMLAAPRDYDGIEAVTYHYRNMEKEMPFFVMPPELKLPDLIFASDGLPVSGNTSVSDLRPSQQLLKLAHSFLWHPVDLNKILEFLNLPYSPLHNHLSSRLAGALQQRPGFENEQWTYAIHDFKNSDKVEEADIAKAMFEYKFWFDRKTYSQKARIPKADVFSIYQHLAAWAKTRLGSQFSGAIYQSIYRLSLDLLDLLDAVDEQSVSMLDLEKLTQIVIQATPATFKEREVGASNFSQNPGAIVFPSKEVIWFNFVSAGSEYIATSWILSERTYLTANGVQLTMPDAQNRLRKWMRYQPFYLASDRLIFIAPAKVEGKYADKHPLHFELEAMIQNIETITKDTSYFDERPNEEVVPKHSFEEGAITEMEPLELNNEEQVFGVTGLENLLFYPHTWILRKQMKLYGSSLTKIKEVNAIKGNIAHKAFEILLDNKLEQADNDSISDWFNKIFIELVHAEGLPFLEYGKEPDLAAFRKELYFSILSFVQALRTNHWKVVATEETLKGKLGINPIKGITDVVLERAGQFLIVDLKWGGKSFRKTMLKNKEDIQLMLYSRFFGEETKWLESCFYIIKDGTFVTRHDGLFKAADIVPMKDPSEEVYDDMYVKLQKTLDWRYDQFRKGQLELRTDSSIQELAALYGEDAFELLPQKTESYRFDDFRALLGEVE